MSDGALGARVDEDPSAVNAEGSHFDVLIIGAGLSGIGAACHLVRNRPRTTLAILEARNAIGGTWDLFRYPGIRSDSDMSTFGYAFRPWNDSTAIADGPSILRYLAETAKTYHDKEHNDDHQWNNHEDQAYKMYAKENHRKYSTFSKLNDNDQQAYWGWRHDHSDALLKINIR